MSILKGDKVSFRTTVLGREYAGTATVCQCDGTSRDGSFYAPGWIVARVIEATNLSPGEIIELSSTSYHKAKP